MQEAFLALVDALGEFGMKWKQDSQEEIRRLEGITEATALQCRALQKLVVLVNKLLELALNLVL